MEYLKLKNLVTLGTLGTSFIVNNFINAQKIFSAS
jgi:hypothetical protein